jgi:hypothetical protein
MRAEFTVRGTRAGEKPHYIMFSTEQGSEVKSGSSIEAGPDSNPDTGCASQTRATDDTCPAPGIDTGLSEQTRKNKVKKTTYKKPPPKRIEISSFPVGSAIINELMPVVIQACSENSLLKEQLFQVAQLCCPIILEILLILSNEAQYLLFYQMQVNYHTTLYGESIVVLLYHKKLDEKWTEAARALRPLLATGSPSSNGHIPHIIGRSRKQKICLDQDFVLEKLLVHGKEFVYRQFEASLS